MVFLYGFYPAYEVPSAAAMMSNQPQILFWTSASLVLLSFSGLSEAGVTGFTSVY